MDNEKLDILKLLIENKESEFSIRQIALKRKVNYKSAYNAVFKLKEEGIVDLISHGNTTICKFNQNFNDSVSIVEHARIMEFLKNKDFKVIHKRVSEINSQFILLLFGSYAKKSQTKHSDIDFLLISENPEQVNRQLNLIPLNIHLTHIKYADFIAMLKSKEFTVVSEALKYNLIFFGIEDYYRMINNAR